MLSVNNVSMRYGARILFEDVTTTFQAGRRYAVTGPNGAGKSTLMKIITGEIEPSKGSITRPKKMGVLSQDQFAFDAFRVIDTVIMGNKLLWSALEEREALYSKDPELLTDEDRSAIAAAMTALEAARGGVDHGSIRASIERLDAASKDFAARRMNRAFDGGLRGKGIAEVAAKIAETEPKADLKSRVGGAHAGHSRR